MYPFHLVLYLMNNRAADLFRKKGISVAVVIKPYFEENPTFNWKPILRAH
jgi:hypothetical protein